MGRIYKVWIKDGHRVVTVPTHIACVLIERFGYPAEAKVTFDGEKLAFSRKGEGKKTRLMVSRTTLLKDFYVYVVPFDINCVLSKPHLIKLTDDDFELVYFVNSRR